jgi:hypothetical protein
VIIRESIHKERVMLTNSEHEKVVARMNFAKTCVKFLKEKCVIKSTNKPFSRWTVSAREATELTFLQHRNRTTPLVDTYISTLDSKLGNCNEKSIVCYVVLKTKPLSLTEGHHVSLVELYGAGEDHVFIIISDIPIKEHYVVDIKALDKCTIIIDAWTEDWFFPNMTFIERYGLGIPAPDVMQLIMRNKIKKTPAIGYEFIRNIV